MGKVEIYKYAKEKLEQRAKEQGISQERLDTVYYQPSKEVRYGSEINNYFYLFCGHLSDRQYMGNIIKFFNKNSDTQKILEEVLFRYDPKKVLAKYDNSSKIMAEINKMDSSKIKNEVKWGEYLDGIYQCAEFLVNNTEIFFSNILKEPKSSDEMKIYLHMLRHIINNIKGVGPAVCYNWIKECGAYWLAKPDLHIKRIVAAFLKKELPYEEDTDEDSDKIISKYLKSNSELRDFPYDKGIKKSEKLTYNEYVALYMFEWAEDIRKSNIDDNITPFKLDRILYIYCTNGNFYMEDSNKSSISERNLIEKIMM